MAARDVQFVVKARDEASRAFESITDAIAQLVSAQNGLGESGGKVSADLNGIVQILAKFEAVSKSVSQTSSSADAAFKKQAAAVTELRTQLNALEEQRIASVRAQGSVTAAGLATGNTEDAVAKSKAIEAAQAQLEKQIARATTQFQRELGTLKELGSQQHNITALAEALQQIGPNVTTTRDQLQAVQAIAGFARQIGESAEVEAAAREKAAAALRDQAAAARQEVAARQSQTVINTNLGVTANPNGSQAAQSAAVFQQQMAAAEAVASFAKQINVEVQKEVGAREKAAQLLRDQAASAQEEVRQAQARAKFDSMLGVTANPNGSQAAQSAAVFQQAADNEERLATAADKYRGIINPTLVIQRQFNTQLQEARDLRAREIISATELLQIEKLLAAEQKRALANAKVNPDGRPSMFGLKPYELTNLGYQVNDVVSGIAMGQRPMQIIAQQGGQILQLMPRVGASILAALSNPAILAAAATFGTIVFAVKEAADQAERLRTIAAVLRSNADGAKYSAAAINEDTKAMADFGLSADEATAIVRTFIKDGLNPEYFTSFGLAAKDMSRILGTDVKTAAEQISTAFTGNYKDIVKLDDATNFLTVAERDHIRAMFESGNAAGARTEAFKIFQRQMGETADKMRGPWSTSFDKLGISWEHLKQSLADSEWANGLLKLIDGVASAFETMAGAMERAKAAKEGFGGGPLDMIANAGIGFGQGLVNGAPSNPGGLPADVKPGPGVGSGVGSVTVKLPPIGEPKASGTSPEQKAASDLQELTKLEQQLADAATSTDRIRLSGQVAYKQAILDGKSALDANIVAEKARADTIRQVERDAVKLFSQNVIGAEGGAGKNPFSSAQGFGQFVDKTWLAEFKKVFSDQAKGLTDDQILALRKNESVAKALIESYAQQNADTLHKFGDIASATNLYLAHFLGAAGANKVLKASPDTPVDQIGLSKGALSGNQGYLRTDNGKGRYRTAGELQTFIAGRIGDTTNDQSGSMRAEGEAYVQLLKAQQEFNDKLKEENASRLLAISYLQQEQGATVDQRNALERQKAIDEAVKRAQDDARQKGTILSPDAQKAIEETTGKVYDLQNAEKLVNDRLNEQQTLRDALLKSIEEAEQRGDTSTVAALTAALGDTDTAFTAAIDAAEKYWKQFDSPEARAAIERLKALRNEVADTAAQLAKVHLDTINQKVGGLDQLRGSLESQVGDQQVLGDDAGAKKSEQALAAVNIQLVQMRQNAIDSAQAMLQMSDDSLAGIGQTRAGLEAFILDQKQAQRQSALMGRQFLMTGKQINEMIADDLVSGMENFLTMVSEGKNVFSSLGIAALQTAADILKSLGEMILKQALFNALSASSQSGGGGVGGSIAAAAGALFPAAIMLQTGGTMLTTAGGTLTTAAGLWTATAAELMAAAQMLIVANSMSFAAAHTGGIAGSPTMHRSVSPLVFAGAARYHRGGLAGLRPNEVPTILERGEEVLTKGDPRHRNNVGRTSGGGGGDPGLKQVLVFNPSDIASALASSEGRKMVLTHIRSAQREIKTMLSSGN